MKRLLYLSGLFLLVVVLASWGSKGHEIIGAGFVGSLPPEMSFFQSEWTNFVIDHSSDADYRKSSDPSESPKHYIDIENYYEFTSTGRLTQSYDSIIALHGFAFVFEQGTLPWATVITYDSLKNAFARGDWKTSEKIAADLSHYVGDGHMPLHITRNYNGQYTGQSGVHSRYESSMVSRYESSIVFSAQQAEYLNDVSQFVFSYIYYNYQYVDSVLAADIYAKSIAGGTSGSAYYDALWNKSGSFTIQLMSHASYSLASLIYTAWVDAGSPRMYPYAIDEQSVENNPGRYPCFPNPTGALLNIPVLVKSPFSLADIRIYNLEGKFQKNQVSTLGLSGLNIIQMNTADLPKGTYLYLLQTGTGLKTGKFIVEK